MTLTLHSLQAADPVVCKDAGNFLQSLFWGSFKARFGWTMQAFSAQWSVMNQPENMPENSLHKIPLLVLRRRLVPGVSFAYVPWGPELPPPFNRAGEGLSAAAEQCTALLELGVRLTQFLPRDTAFIRFDLPWQSEECLSPPLWGNSFMPKDGGYSGPALQPGVNVQAPDTVILDLAPGEEELLAAMKPKWRYNIGLAEKKGVAVRIAASSLGGQAVSAVGSENAGAAGGAEFRQGLESFYAIYRETAARDGIAIHGMNYYTVLFEEAARHGVDVRLYLASHENEDIAGIVTLFRGGEAVYLYGASANRKRNLMAPYALQWRAMKDAKAAGCRGYDLFGIPPLSPEEDPNHPMAGLYRFKTGFGGTIIHRPGCRDYPCRPVVFALYSIAEAARKKIRDRKKRR